MANLVKIMDMVNEDLKKLYKSNPTGVWLYPCLLLVDNDGHVRELDGKVPEADLFKWLCQNMDLKKIKSVIVGRMVVKYGEIIDPNTNAPTITQKAIMVMGKDLSTNRSRVIITECKEHRDYRTQESIEKGMAEGFDPSVKGADVTKMIVDEASGKIASMLTARFGDETIMDTRDGQTFLLDPLMDGIISVRNLDKEIASADDLNKPGMPNL